MKIIAISRLYPPSTAARAIQFGRVINALRERGCSITVISDEATNSSRPVATKTPTTMQKILSKLAYETRPLHRWDAWTRSATNQLITQISEDKPDAILSSSQPFESHLPALHTAAKAKIPWVAMLSDPWPANILPTPYRDGQTVGLTWLQRNVSQTILRRSNAIVLTSDLAARCIEEELKISIQDKIKIIPHIGIRAGGDCKFPIEGHWLVHVGQITRERVSIILLKTIRRLRDETNSKLSGLLCVGNVCKEFRQAAHEIGLDNCIQYIDSVSPPEALALIKTAWVNISIEAEMPYSPFLPSKIPDLIVCGRPLVAVCPKESATTFYSGRYDHVFAAAQEESQLYAAISNAIQSSNENMLTMPEEFSASYIGRQYMDVMSECIYNN